MSDEMKWIPSDWLDEELPALQTDPNAFVCRHAELGWMLRPVEEQDEDLDEGFGILHLVDGQVVRFSASIYYGDFELVVREDGSFETDREIPTKANCFRVDHDTDTLQPSLRELVVNDDGGLEPGIHAIDACWWSEAETVFTFRIVDGKGQLTRVGVVQ
ncbi:hypothetical protein [Rhizobium sp. N324]|uniref:hypothetical protein n=1 Tax=Rhizobium sp. N324 TaxID=1703969 RepID=UPI0007EBE916|nr:hypothetical protein [Rhizobium sp. N324]ANM12094.1 hypothetical protein AMK05_CH03745 [Rhizobium sp. N324]